MTDPQNFSGLGDLLKKVMENPELLSGAMSMASALASSGALNSLLGKKPGGEGDNTTSQTPPNPPPSNQPDPSGLSGMAGLSGLSGLMKALGGSSLPPPGQDPPSGPNPPPGLPPHPMRGMHRERIALLEAMRPFISHEKKDRLELLIRLLGVMEIAEGMGLGG